MACKANLNRNMLGLSIKDVRNQGRREFVQNGHFSDKGGSDADVRTFWYKNLRIFQNLWCVRTDKRRASEDIFGQVGVKFFAILCGRLLWPVPLSKQSLGPSIKDVRSQEEGVCPVRTFNGQGDFFRCGRPHFFAQKNPDISKFMVCPHGQGGRGLSQGGRSIFQDFMRMFFMDVSFSKRVYRIRIII